MILKYELTQNNETKYAVVTGLENNNQSSNKLVIPCTTQIGSISYPVLEISKSAFNGCKDLEEVFILNTNITIGQLAFHNCQNLKKISFSSGIKIYDSQVFGACDSIEEISVKAIDYNHCDFSAIRTILQACDKGILLNLNFTDTDEKASLFFPHFVEGYEEDTFARAMHHFIEGCGYAYRECVTNTEINITEYDQLYKRVCAEQNGHGEACLLTIFRLGFPWKASGKILLDMSKFMWNNTNDCVNILIEKGMDEVLDYFCSHNYLNKSDLSKCIKKASQQNNTKICSVLMNYTKEKKHNTMLSLDDF